MCFGIFVLTLHLLIARFPRVPGSAVYLQEPDENRAFPLPL